MLLLEIILVIGSIAGCVAGQTVTTTAGTATGTASNSKEAVTYTVTVGKGDHTFRPDVLLANVGDIVQFHFFPPNHSVVRAEYEYPCIPYEMTGRGKVGFWSGFQPVDAILDSPPTWSIKINDTNPIFYYCSAPDACIKYAMVGVINPNATVSLQHQKDLAQQAKYALNPGDSFPAEGSSTSVSSLSSSSRTSSTVVATTSTSTVTPAESPTPSHKSGLPAGAIAGIVVGAVIILALVAGLLFFIGRTKTLKDTVNRQSLGSSSAGFLHSPGHMSPASTPLPPLESAFQAGDTVFVPIKASDLHRASLPPYNNPGSPLHSISNPGPQFPLINHYDVGVQNPRVNPHSTTTPAEMHAE